MQGNYVESVERTRTRRHSNGLRHHSVRRLRAIANAYWQERGDFAYAAYEWANELLFGGRIDPPMMTWALTPYGKCIGMTSLGNLDVLHPVITLHPRCWREGLLYTLDTIVHEMTHVHVEMMRQGGSQCRMTTSHDNELWTGEVERISPLIGLGNVVASRTKRKRHNGRMLRVPVSDGALSMKVIGTWPGSMRAPSYYKVTSLPFDWSPIHNDSND